MSEFRIKTDEDGIFYIPRKVVNGRGVVEDHNPACGMISPTYDGSKLSLADIVWFRDQPTACVCCRGDGFHQSRLMGMTLTRVCTHCEGTGVHPYYSVN